MFAARPASVTNASKAQPTESSPNRRMSSRVIVQLLLSLLLLVSQQLALAHGYTHVHRIATEQLQEQLQGQDDGGQQTPAADHLCAQCLSADQLAYALGVPDYHFKVAGNGYLPCREISAQPASAKAVRAFQPRAPPRA